jgi:hypothetical protein
MGDTRARASRGVAPPLWRNGERTAEVADGTTNGVDK